MKITDLRCAVIGKHPIVRITTDEGLHGLGEVEFTKTYLKPFVLHFREALLGTKVETGNAIFPGLDQRRVRKELARLPRILRRQHLLFAFQLREFGFGLVGAGLLRLGDDLRLDVGRDPLVAQEFHLVHAAPAGH